METLAPPNTHHVTAAIGWMELGNLVEAKAELAKVSPDLAEHPDVLETAWAIYATASDWERARETADRLVGLAPDQPSGWLHRAYALRRVTGGGLQAAWDALFPAADRFPEEATIPYNLACYACQMEQLEAARRWLQRAMSVGQKSSIRGMALRDPDLEPLWREIKTF